MYFGVATETTVERLWPEERTLQNKEGIDYPESAHNVSINGTGTG